MLNEETCHFSGVAWLGLSPSWRGSEGGTWGSCPAPGPQPPSSSGGRRGAWASELECGKPSWKQLPPRARGFPVPLPKLLVLPRASQASPCPQRHFLEQFWRTVLWLQNSASPEGKSLLNLFYLRWSLGSTAPFHAEVFTFCICPTRQNFKMSLRIFC